jgi:type III pantothenate kinase
VLLCVDVGNSHTVLGLFDGERLVRQWRLRTQRLATVDELVLQATALLQQAGVAFQGVRGLALGCVVPPLRQAWLRAGREHFGCPVLLAGPEATGGLRLDVERPAEVGADRIADGVSAWRRHGAPAIVVDCGTATTVDAIGDGGRYLGGAIAPGVGVSYEALVASAALLQSVELRVPTRALGVTTAQQMLSGVVFGLAGQVDALVERIRSEMGGAELVVATGGWAGLLLSASRTVTRHDPDLTLHGLRLIFAGAASDLQEDPLRRARTVDGRPAPEEGAR